MGSTDDEFRAAVEALPRIPEDPGNLVKLRMYALYKQAVEGDVGGTRPGPMRMVERAKYDAWSSVRGMSSEDAKREYADVVRRLLG